MHNVEALTDKAIEIVKDSIGEDKLTNRIFRPIKINTRAKRRWGLCKADVDGCLFGYTIEISSTIIQDNIPEDKLMNVIIHEILHACKNGMTHKGEWRKYANIVNEKYPQYNITTTTSYAEFGLVDTEVFSTKHKYCVKCKGCGLKHYSSRLSKTIKYPERYFCNRCGNALERIQ